MKTTVSRRQFILSCAATVALCALPARTRAAAESTDGKIDYYTCTMHPSVHAKDPGNCPICGMQLVPVMKPSAIGSDSAGAAPDADRPRAFNLPLNRQQLIGVTFATVAVRPLRRTVRATGVVASENGRHWDIVSRVQGYVQQLIVTSPGDVVEKGQPLLKIYSPDLFATQRELVDLLRMRDSAPASGADVLIASAEQRLRQWNITDGEIAELEKTRRPQETLTLVSPAKGIIHHIHIEQGKDVSVGTDLVDMADLSEVWIWVDFYQNESAQLKPGLPVTITTPAFPNEKFTGKIAVIDAFLNDERRTVRVRLDIANPDLQLRPDMYVDAALQLDLGRGLTVPFDAVLPTGEHNVVFVDKGGGNLEPRFVKIGGTFGDDCEVVSGLAEGERVVNSANFLIDAESKVQGALKSW